MESVVARKSMTMSATGVCPECGAAVPLNAAPGLCPQCASQGARDGKANIIDILPLRKPNGAPVNGLPNPCLAASEVGYDIFLNLLTTPAVGGDPDGLDIEGLTIDEQGNFWVCEEYQPSLAEVTLDGTVQFRLVPKGAKLCGTEVIPTYDVLPSSSSVGPIAASKASRRKTGRSTESCNGH
jgi:hypothetical protein